MTDKGNGHHHHHHHHHHYHHRRRHTYHKDHPHVKKINGVRLPPINNHEKANVTTTSNHLQQLIQKTLITNEEEVSPSNEKSADTISEEFSSTSSLVNEETVMDTTKMEECGSPENRKKSIRFNIPLQSRENSLNSLIDESDEDSLISGDGDGETNNEDGRWMPVSTQCVNVPNNWQWSSQLWLT